MIVSNNCKMLCESKQACCRNSGSFRTLFLRRLGLNNGPFLPVRLTFLAMLFATHVRLLISYQYCPEKREKNKDAIANKLPPTRSCDGAPQPCCEEITDYVRTISRQTSTNASAFGFTQMWVEMRPTTWAYLRRLDEKRAFAATTSNDVNDGSKYPRWIISGGSETSLSGAMGSEPHGESL